MNCWEPGTNKFGFLLPMAMLSACTSYQYQPDADSLLISEDCQIVNGQYIVESDSDGELLAGAIFETDEPVSTMEIERSATQVSIRGKTRAGQTLTRNIPERFSCRNSVLTLVLQDEGSGGGMGVRASDTKLELFSENEGFLNFRFIDTAFTMLLIIPYYESDDEEIVLRRIDEVTR